MPSSTCEFPALFDFLFFLFWFWLREGRKGGLGQISADEVEYLAMLLTVENRDA